MRTLAITQNVTVDGSIEMLGEWFDPQGRPDADNSDLFAAMERHQSAADALVLGRTTFEDIRGHWPDQGDADTTGVTDCLNRVRKYVVSSRMSDPRWPNMTMLSGDPIDGIRALKRDPRAQAGRRTRHRGDEKHLRLPRPGSGPA